MKLLKSIARKVYFPLIHLLHIDARISRKSKRESLILCLHGVTQKPDFSINKRHMDVNQFDKLIQAITRDYEVVDLKALFDPSAATAKTTKKKICLTFDDGYLDNLTTALPILKKYRVPATFFIISNGLTENDFVVWTDLLDFVFKNTTGSHIKLGKHLFEKQNGVYKCPELNNIDIIEHIKSLGSEKYSLIKELALELSGLEQSMKLHPDYWKLLTASELKKFSESPYVTIGSHTKSHHNLSNVDEILAKAELEASKREIESVIGNKITIIAYPDGSYNDRVKDLAEEAGYTCQLAVDYRCASDSSDARILPRLSVSNSTTYQSNLLRIAKSFDQLGI